MTITVPSSLARQHLTSLASTLDSTPDDSLLRSAHEAASVPTKFGPTTANRPLDPQVQARLRYYETLKVDIATLQTQLVNQLDAYLILDRKQALQKLKTMPVGDIVIVPFVHANNIRVACHYNAKHYEKAMRTETIKLGDARYLKVMRVD